VTEKTLPRPPQVTLAAGLVIVGSVFVVLSAFDQIAGLHTLDTREAVEKMLDDGIGKSLGLDVEGTLSIIRVLTMVSAACATAAGILGYQVLRRSKSARLVLTLLALPLFVTGIAVGGFFPALVVGAIVMLWFQPARDWMDGKAPRPAPSPPPLPVLPPAPPTHVAPEPPTSGEPRPVSGFGDRANLLASLPPPTSAPLGHAPGAVPSAASGTRRPPALVWACVLAWAGSGLAAFSMFASVVVILSDPELLREDVVSSGLTMDDVQGPLLYACVLLLIWSLVAIVIAGYAFTGRPWAWNALVVSSVASAGLCLLGTFGNPFVLIAFGVCAATAVLLMRPDVRTYFR
jgi:hypothetical protein